LGGALKDGHKAREAIKNLPRKMGRKRERKGDLCQKIEMQTALEEEPRKLELTWRYQEVLENPKKMFRVYVHPTIRFNFPSLGFLMRFAN
jgi:hypothetical protein